MRSLITALSTIVLSGAFRAHRTACQEDMGSNLSCDFISFFFFKIKLCLLYYSKFAKDRFIDVMSALPRWTYFQVSGTSLWYIYFFKTCIRVWMDGWIRVLRPFNSISVISRRWKGEHERLCAMKRRLGSGRISPPAGFEPATPWSEVGSANRSATRTLHQSMDTSKICRNRNPSGWA